MPIYEFYCSDCHTVFSFFTGRPRVDAAPACPRCRRPDLERKPSRFATVRGRGDAGDESGGGDPFAGVDEGRLERAMEALMAEAGGMGGSDDAGGLDEDPRAIGRLMRRFGSLAGLELGERMEAMVARLEAGEDPEALEAEMGDLDDPDSDDLEAFFRLKKAATGRRPPPAVDDELYFL